MDTPTPPVRRSPRLQEALLRLPEGMFTTGDARRRDVPQQQLQRLVAAGALLRHQRGVYSVTEEGWSDPLRRIKVTGFSADVVLAHLSAARVHGLRTPYLEQREDSRLHLLCDRVASHVRKQGSVVVLPAEFEPTHVMEVADGVRVTRLERTALDLARGCPLERALVVMDHAMALGADRDICLALLEFMRGWPGTRVLRPALAHANALAESGLESMVRGHCLASSLPAPTLQLPIRSDSGRSYRADLAWVAEKAILEVDGREKLKTRDDLVAEKFREDDLRDSDWRVVRITFEDLKDPQRHRLRRLAHLLGVPLQPYDPEWQQTPKWDLVEARARRRARRRDQGVF